jgi:hypothetical protein
MSRCNAFEEIRKVVARAVEVISQRIEVLDAVRYGGKVVTNIGVLDCKYGAIEFVLNTGVYTIQVTQYETSIYLPNKFKIVLPPELADMLRTALDGACRKAKVLAEREA